MKRLCYGTLTLSFNLKIHKIFNFVAVNMFLSFSVFLFSNLKINTKFDKQGFL